MPLTPEQATAAFQAKHIGLSPSGFETLGYLRTREAIAQIEDDDLRATAFALIRRDRDGLLYLTIENTNEYRPEDIQAMREARLRLIRAPLDERLTLLNPFFPRFAPTVSHLIDLMLQHQPYVSLGLFSPFRPSSDDIAKADLISGFVLHQIYGATLNHDADLLWWAEHAGYDRYAQRTLGKLFAAAIDQGNEQIFEVLRASAYGQHPVGIMGEHVVQGLLSAERPDGWSVIEDLLLNAQREEGLRETILRALIEANPLVFRRIIRTMVDHDLARFSSVILAVNQWFFLAYTVKDVTLTRRFLRLTADFLDDPSAMQRAIESGSAEDAYIALWVMGRDDVKVAAQHARSLLDSPDVERRYIAVHCLNLFGEASNISDYLNHLDDPDIRIGLHILYNTRGKDKALINPSTFEKIEQLLVRLPKQDTALEPLVWPWTGITSSRKHVALYLFQRPEPAYLRQALPYLSLIGGYEKANIFSTIIKSAAFAESDIREVVWKELPKLYRYARDVVFNALRDTALTDDDYHRLEALLAHKKADLHHSALSLIKQRPVEQRLISAERLLQTKHVNQQIAGLELLLSVQRDPEGKAFADRVTAAYQDTQPTLTPRAQDIVNELSNGVQANPTLDDGLGLFNPAERTPPLRPQPRPQILDSDAADRLLTALHDLIIAHRTTPVRLERESKDRLLGQLTHNFPARNEQVPIEDDIKRLPLHEVWVAAYRDRPADQRDPDGLELLRAYLKLMRNETGIRNKPDGFAYGVILGEILKWLWALFPVEGAAEFILDALENVLVGFADDSVVQKAMSRESGSGLIIRPDVWGKSSWHTYVGLLGFQEYGRQLSHEDQVRWWGLLRWIDEPVSGFTRRRPEFFVMAYLHERGIATDADVYEALIGSRKQDSRYEQHFHDLESLSHPLKLPKNKRMNLLDRYPKLQPIYDRICERLLEVELRRAMLPTAASKPINSLQRLHGTDTLLRVLLALGSNPLSQSMSDYQDRISNLSRLIYVSAPGPDETPEQFAAKAAALKLPDERWVTVAMFVPRWARHIEALLGWEGLASAVYWVHAHGGHGTSEVYSHAYTFSQPSKLDAEITAHSDFQPAELLQNKVDVQWFRRMYQTLGATRWAAVIKAAKYATLNNDHARPVLYSRVLLGEISEEELWARIDSKRHQESVRAFGLIPLPEDPLARIEALQRRYLALQTFLRGSRKFGVQRRENEAAAVSLAIARLAQMAGYDDPQRLIWAMEAREASDLQNGQRTETLDGVTLTLSIDSAGRADLTVERAGKALKDIPAKLKKDPTVIELRQRRQQLDQQYSRMRQTFEAAMCRAEVFTGAELRDLCVHPVLAPMLGQLVFIGVDDPTILGYPVEGGQALYHHDSRRIPIGDATPLRIAHAVDLLHGGEWSAWQREAFTAGRVQPFKQVFREVYTVTETEQEEDHASRRYAGHQVQSNKALALLGARNWISHYGELPYKIYAHAGITVSVGGLYGYGTAAMVEDVALETVWFYDRHTYKRMALADVPPLVFSEAMRDLDLVVSVAHSSGVDPEATASTLDMRAALVHETCALLKLANVKTEGRFVLVEGKLGLYSIHLGSANVHKMPGGSLCIIPVHGQHRGRVFLPFADDDPKTAEVVSKVVLLARDSDIKDPVILAQIYR